MMVLKNANFKVNMKGSQTLDRSRDILCINETYVLVIAKYDVLYTVMQPNICFFLNNLLISTGDEGRTTTVKKLEKKGASDLGTIYSPRGDIKSAFLYERELILLNFSIN